MAELASLSAAIHGRVQGVFFRDFVREHAELLGLTGYVRNLPGGRSVEVRAEGEREKLLLLLRHLERGPRGAKVERVDVNWSEYIGSFHRFQVKYY
jgi:acylphosphatase